VDRSKHPNSNFVFQRRGRRCPCPLDTPGRAAEKQTTLGSSVAINRPPLAGFARKRQVQKLRCARSGGSDTPAQSNSRQRNREVHWIPLVRLRVSCLEDLVVNLQDLGVSNQP